MNITRGVSKVLKRTDNLKMNSYRLKLYEKKFKFFLILIFFLDEVERNQLKFRS